MPRFTCKAVFDHLLLLQQLRGLEVAQIINDAGNVGMVWVFSSFDLRHTGDRIVLYQHLVGLLPIYSRLLKNHDVSYMLDICETKNTALCSTEFLSKK